MKKQIFGLSFLLLLGLGVSAQTTDKTVEKIRAYYTIFPKKPASPSRTMIAENLAIS